MPVSSRNDLAADPSKTLHRNFQAGREGELGGDAGCEGEGEGGGEGGEGGDHGAGYELAVGSVLVWVLPGPA